LPRPRAHEGEARHHPGENVPAGRRAAVGLPDAAGRPRAGACEAHPAVRARARPHRSRQGEPMSAAAALVQELVPAPDPLDTCARFQDLPFLLFLDSASDPEHLGRYSFLAADPATAVRSKGLLTQQLVEGTWIRVAADPLAHVGALVASHAAQPVVELPPFQGGAAGYVGSDWGMMLERVPRPRYDDLAVPDLLLRLYGRLRHRNPAPFSAYLDFGDLVVASSSPERFLRVEPGGRVETRPIKGTRPRGLSPEHDAALARALVESDKDRAENVMIVDLLRNDLSRVCRAGTVRVPELFAIEHYATVHHLVSTVVGELAPERDAVDLFRAAFPGGSITGAPKVRAMQIIAELEPTQRAAYCGSIGYLSLSGAADTSIVIRTCLVLGSDVYFQVGGGIVADSDPALEYRETLDKARGLIAALVP